MPLVKDMADFYFNYLLQVTIFFIDSYYEVGLTHYQNTKTSMILFNFGGYAKLLKIIIWEVILWIPKLKGQQHKVSATGLLFSS